MEIIPNILSNEQNLQILPRDRFYQSFGLDFNETQLNDFISEHMLYENSKIMEIYNSINQRFDIEKTCSIHIRNGDYLNHSIIDYFDRHKYISYVIQQINPSIETINVYSDQIDICEQQYDNILSRRFKNINYISNSTVQDFCELCAYKTKILFNSTFSFWTAYVSNVLYGMTNCKSIWSPKILYKNSDRENTHTNKNWNLVDVEKL